MVLRLHPSTVFLKKKAVDDCLRFISFTLFRPLPEDPVVYDNDSDEVVPFQDPFFDMLQKCYELLNALVSSSLLHELITPSFLHQLVHLFFSNDKRERAQLRITIHHMYARFPSRRALFRKEFQSVIHDIAASQSDLAGVEDVLEFYAIILMGVVVPIHDDHLLFMRQCLFQLLKKPRLESCFSGIDNCFRLLVIKDPSLCVDV